ncbi:mitotic-spindle organizing protein 2B-like [Haliotis rubra]|uniref:mitotic-spindle organizing protein 2B-like n=1 Tax=Haliotis rubra TaxID=36100 RepID=UPI001EE60D69|nr:mitotic-spindle organizing protein 2B-like [Haliotis rubra]
MTSSSQVLQFSLLSKNILTPEEAELYELGQLGGITLDPGVFKIIMDLLKMNVAPTAILHMLKSMCSQRKKKHTVVDEEVMGQRGSRSATSSGSRPRQGSGSRRVEARR